MLLGRALVQPQRILHHAVRCEAAGITVCLQKAGDGLKGNLDLAQAEDGVAARVEADVHQLVVAQRREGILAELAGDLRVARIVGVARPLRVDLNGRSVHRIETHRHRCVSGGVDLGSAEAADQHVLNDLLHQRSEAVALVRCLERTGERRDACSAVACCVLWRTLPRLDAPVHARNAVFNTVDRAARDRCLRKAAKVGRRRFGQRGLHARGTERREDRT